MAYFTVFSLGPLLFILLGVLGLISSSEIYREKLLAETSQITGPRAAEGIEKLLNADYLRDQAGAALLIGAVGLVLAAVGIFGQLQRSLNDILRVKTGPAVGLKAIAVQKAVSLLLIGIAGALLLASVLSSVLISAFKDSFELGGLSSLVSAADFGLSVLIVTIMLAMIYRILPDVKLPWKLLFKFAAAVAVMFAGGTFLLSIIISGNATISAFGAAGSVVALLLWIYYSGLIVYIGAAAISIYAHNNKVPMEPRYKGPGGVMKISQKEESLSPPIIKKIEKKFAKGIKKGRRK